MQSIRRTLGLAALSAACALAGAPTLSAQAVDTEGNSVDAARSALEEWVAVRAEIAAEKRNWTVGKEVLTDRIDVLKGEIESFRARIAEARVSIGTADDELDELRADEVALATASDSVQAVVIDYEERTKSLLTCMPVPLLEKVEVIRQRFPEDPATTKMSLSQRFVTIAGILNELNKFNGEIHQTSEVRELAGGGTSEVATIYVGLGQAYYVTADGSAAGVGIPGPNGWAWTARNDAAQQIAAAVAILNDEDVAAFVRLPLTVHRGVRR